MSEIRSQLATHHRIPQSTLVQRAMNEVEDVLLNEKKQESVIAPSSSVDTNERPETLISTTAEVVEEQISNGVAVEATPELVPNSFSQSKPINVAPFKTVSFSLSLTNDSLQIDFTIVGYSTPFVIYYPLNGAASAKKTAEKFCRENYDNFQLTEESYNSCVDPIWGEIERVAGEFIKVCLITTFSLRVLKLLNCRQVNLKINSESYTFNINLNDSDSCDYAAADFCFKFVSPDVFDSCKAQVSAKLFEESRLQQRG